MINAVSKVEEELKEEDVPQYDPIDISHYKSLQLKYIKDRRYFRGIDEHREILEIEMNDEIPQIARNFRKWYYENYQSKVMPKTRSQTNIMSRCIEKTPHFSVELAS